MKKNDRSQFNEEEERYIQEQVNEELKRRRQRELDDEVYRRVNEYWKNR